VAPAAPRDLKSAAAALQNATVVDTQLFKPTSTVGGCAPTDAPLIASPPSPNMQAAIDAAKAYSQSEKGVGLVILKDGRKIHESYIPPYSAETVTDSYSMHKSVLALAIGIAIDDGMIRSVDDPVGRYIAEWESDPRGKITLRDLLSMQSGLKLFSFSDPSGEWMELMLASDINAVALRHPATEQPRATFRYNNVNSQIVGIALERALKKRGYRSYADFLSKKLWCPLGNQDAKLWLDREDGAPHYYSAMFGHLTDWARVGDLFRTKGSASGRKIVSPSWIAEMAKPAISNASYGLHIWRGTPWAAKRQYSSENPIVVPHRAPYKADDVLFFDGFGGQRVYVVPSAGLTIARSGFVNFNYDDSVIVNLLLDAM
jgi:CubicO group peptidase (beta-lactamase class C family)